MAVTTTEPKDLGYTPPSTKGLWSWITTIDHKRIGIMYAVASLVFFLVGGLEALLIRAQLATANSTLVSADAYNQLAVFLFDFNFSHSSPDEGIVDPALVPISMFNVQPAVLALEDFKGNTLFNCKKDFLRGGRPGADIT